MLFERIAQDALNDLVENGVKAAEDRLDDAINYAEDAYVDLGANSDYDPAIHSMFLAQKAAEEYVKAKIMGRNPIGTISYASAAQAWTRSAAAEVSKTRDKTHYETNRLFKELENAK